MSSPTQPRCRLATTELVETLLNDPGSFVSRVVDRLGEPAPASAGAGLVAEPEPVADRRFRERERSACGYEREAENDRVAEPVLDLRVQP